MVFISDSNMKRNTKYHNNCSNAFNRTGPSLAITGSIDIAHCWFGPLSFTSISQTWSEKNETMSASAPPISGTATTETSRYAIEKRTAADRDRQGQGPSPSTTTIRMHFLLNFDQVAYATSTSTKTTREDGLLILPFTTIVQNISLMTLNSAHL